MKKVLMFLLLQGIVTATLNAQTSVNEGFSGGVNQTIDFSGTGTQINGVTYHGFNTDQTASVKYPVQVKGEKISIWCQYNKKVGDVSWTSESTDNGITNLTIDLSQNTTLYNFKSRISRPSGGHWWYRIQYSINDGTDWVLLKGIGSQITGSEVYIDEILGTPVQNVDKVRINIWRNGNNDPNEILIHNVNINTVNVNAETNISSSGFTASWDAISGADSYTVKLYSDSGLQNSLGNKTGLTGSSGAITHNFADGDTIYYTVTALNGVTPLATSSPQKFIYFKADLEIRHRYSFTSDATDSVGTADLTLSSGSTSGKLPVNGSVTADATGASLSRIGEVFNNAAAVTVEGWYELTGNNNWSKVFLAGSNSSDFIALTPKTSVNANAVQIISKNSGVATLTTANPALNTKLYFAITYDEVNNKMIYRHAAEGDSSVSKVETDMGNNSISGLTFSIFSLGSNNFWGNPKINGSIDEFRIWTGDFTDQNATTHFGAGPDGTVTPAIGLEVTQTGIELEWSVEDEIDVKEYQVWADGSLYETVQAQGADSYTVKIPKNADIILKVVDKSGFVKPYIPADGNIVTERYELKQGWNLIAITSDNADLETLTAETVGAIWGWNGKIYTVIDSVNATDAVWVYAPTAKTVDVTGTKSDAKIKLNVGWNMVGPISDDYLPEGAGTVYAWDKVYDEIAGKSKLLIGGKGYWIFSL